MVEWSGGHGPLDAGRERWENRTIPGGGELDFRDVEALDADTVLVMSAGTGAASRIYRTTDGGATWKLLHTNPDPEGFYDAMAFWDSRRGLLLGDPVHGHFVVRMTDDGGVTWRDPTPGMIPMALPGEGAFAASGSCLTVRKGGAEAWFVTGGARMSRVFRTSNGAVSWNSSAGPVPAGNPSSGLFSVAFLDAPRGFVSGGDYKQPDLEALNGARTEDGGRTWKAAPIGETGFYSGSRSCRTGRTVSWPSDRKVPPSAATPAGRGAPSTARRSTRSPSPEAPAGPSARKGRSSDTPRGGADPAAVLHRSSFLALLLPLGAREQRDRGQRLRGEGLVEDR